MKKMLRTTLTSAFLLVALLFTQNSPAQLTSRPPGDTFPCPGEWIPDCNPKARELVKQFHQIKTGILPNPARSYFTLLVSEAESVTAEIKVYDANGMLRYEVCGSAYQTYRFGQDFIAGLYFVQVRCGRKQVTMKVLKL